MNVEVNMRKKKDTGKNPNPKIEMGKAISCNKQKETVKKQQAKTI